MIERVNGISEMELENKNPNSELKHKMINRKEKSSFEFQSVFEYEVKRLKEKV